MKIERTLNFIFVSLLLSLMGMQPIWSQSEKINGVAVGFDLSRLVVKGFEPERTALEVSARVLVKPKWFAVAEAGYENVDFDNLRSSEEKSYDYASNGSYLRVGVDYDFFKVEEFGNNDNVYVGLRYGFCLMEHEAPGYTVENDFWGASQEGSIAPYTLNVHWAEFVFGLRTELFRNFYMGWSARLKVKVVENNDEVLSPFVVGGYGKGDNQLNLGFTYSLAYEIPYHRKRKK